MDLQSENGIVTLFVQFYRLQNLKKYGKILDVEIQEVITSGKTEETNGIKKQESTEISGMYVFNCCIGNFRLEPFGLGNL